MTHGTGVNLAIVLLALASQPSPAARLELDLSSAVEPAELSGLWMNSKGELVQCTPDSCAFRNSKSDQAHLLTRSDFRGTPAVALGSTGWKAVRANRAGVAWRRLNSKGQEKTLWWDKLPSDAHAVLAKMDGTRWHNDVGESIFVSGTEVCFTKCYGLKIGSLGFIYYNTWVLIDYFRNTRGNMEVHWRKEETSSSKAGQDIVWYTDSMKPVAGTFTGVWMNTGGQIAECGNGRCTFDIPPGSPKVMHPTSKGIALGTTGWVAIDFDQAGVTWERGSEHTWWNKLPEDPTAVIERLTRVHEWTNTDGQRIVVQDGCVYFNHNSCDRIRASQGKVLLDTGSKNWVACDLFENKNGQFEVLWRQQYETGDSEDKQQTTVRWYQKDLD